jgi:hypothetical protein
VRYLDKAGDNWETPDILGKGLHYVSYLDKASGVYVRREVFV